MKAFFEPKSVAIIGASETEGKVGWALMNNMKKFNGKVFPINPKHSDIMDFKTYKSVLDVKDSIDLAVIAVKAEIVPKVLEQCGKKKIKAVVIISAGFGEVGNKKGEEEVKKIGKEYGIRMMGPNNFGVVNPWMHLDTSFSRITPDKGEIGFISQSGALWAALSLWSVGRVGFSKFASLGNMVDVDFSDLIEYFDKDEKTKVIMCYIETLRDGKRFMDVCRHARKPIIVIKAGIGEAGTKAALSHTGSLAGSYDVYKAAFKQSGVYLVSNITEAFDKAEFLADQKSRGKRTLIVTDGGGVGVLTADYCEKFGLKVVELPKKFISKMGFLSKAWSKNNPMDLVGDADWEQYGGVFKELLKWNFYDNVIVVLMQQGMIDVLKTAEQVAWFKRKSGKAVVCCFMGGPEVESAEKYLQAHGVPCYFEPERAVKVLSNV